MQEQYSILKAQASEGSLPEDFDNWSLADNNGLSIAHIAATREKGLPKHFKDWEIKTNTSWTVAHEYVKAGRNPEGLRSWFISDLSGKTVLDVYHERKKKLPKTSLKKKR